MTSEASFSIGQTIHHRLFDYRGVIVDVDPFFSGSEDWYHTIAQSRPPKDQPWYRVLVDGGEQMTYVAQRNLEDDASGEPIHHPALPQFFRGFQDGVYIPNRRMN